MKKLAFVVLILVLPFTVTAQKNTTPQDSITIFYDDLFFALKNGYLHKDAVNWKIIESETKQNLQKYATFQNSLSEIKNLFDKIGATHCNVYYNGIKYSSTGKNISKDDYSEQWKKKYDTRPGFEVKVVNEKYGYILMPALVSFDISAQNIHKIAQPLYDQIADVNAKNKVDGWIIDLRFNTGGNSWPMLLALYDFLGDNDIGGSLNENKKQESKSKLNKGMLIERSKKIAYINPVGKLLTQKKVSVITGIFTASSGEVVALAFKGRPNTKFIGESSYGATTGNISYPLPFNGIMALTNSYDSDRNGNFYEKIIPDTIILKQDNFDDLLLDKKIQEAIKFIDHKE